MISCSKLRQIRLGLVGLTGLALLPAALSAVDSKKVDFNRDVRPILSDNCYACHGPDAGKRKAGLRLDLKEVALSKLKSDNFAIVPAHPEKSSLVERIITKNEDDRMPPIKTGKTLSPEQINLLTRWIKEGAVWQPHWSFIKPERPAVPEVKAKRWARNPIDNFILARLEKEKLKPSTEADKPHSFVVSRLISLACRPPLRKWMPLSLTKVPTHTRNW
jgi:mono/diheme cytochrome c family protein